MMRGDITISKLSSLEGKQKSERVITLICEEEQQINLKI